MTTEIIEYGLKINGLILQFAPKQKITHDIINTIIKSSYIPYLIDGNILYENKSIDGVTPFIFKEREKQQSPIS